MCINLEKVVRVIPRQRTQLYLHTQQSSIHYDAEFDGIQHRGATVNLPAYRKDILDLAKQAVNLLLSAAASDKLRPAQTELHLYL